MKRVLFAAGMAAILVVGGVVVARLNECESSNCDPRFIGYYPPLMRLHNGMTEAQVTSILGHPNSRRKARANDLREGTEVWDYTPAGWHGHIEVTFDAKGKVRYVNYGHA